MQEVRLKVGRTYLSGIFILLGAVLVGLALSGFATILIWTTMTGKGVMELGSAMLLPENRNALQVIQIVSTFIMFFLPAWFAAWYLTNKPLRFLGFQINFSPRQWVIVLLVMCAAIPLVASLGELNKMIPLSQGLETKFKALEDEYIKQVKVISNITSFPEYLLALLILALAPAIVEETLFRGGLQNLLFRSTRSPWVAIIITSVIFSAIHMSFYGFLPRLVLGIILGIFFHYTGSIWLSIWGHFLNNGFAATQIYYYVLKGKNIDDAINETYPMWWGLLGLAVLIFLIRYFLMYAAEDRTNYATAEEPEAEKDWMT